MEHRGGRRLLTAPWRGRRAVAISRPADWRLPAVATRNPPAGPQLATPSGSIASGRAALFSHIPSPDSAHEHPCTP